MAPGLYGKVVGFVGMGDIARETARILHVSSGGRFSHPHHLTADLLDLTGSW